MCIATILYGMSTVMTYYNFTWSFYGNLLIMLPMSIWAMERFFKERKIGWFILRLHILYLPTSILVITKRSY